MIGRIDWIDHLATLKPQDGRRTNGGRRPGAGRKPTSALVPALRAIQEAEALLLKRASDKALGASLEAVRRLTKAEVMVALEALVEPALLILSERLAAGDWQAGLWVLEKISGKPVQALQVDQRTLTHITFTITRAREAGDSPPEPATPVGLTGRIM